MVVAMEKPDRNVIVAFCEDTDGPELSEEEVREIVDYIGIPGTVEQLKRVRAVHLRGRLAVLTEKNQRAYSALSSGRSNDAEVTYQFACRKAFREYIRENYLSPEEMAAREIEKRDKAEAERLAAERIAEERRQAEEQRLAEAERARELAEKQLEAEELEREIQRAKKEAALDLGPLYLKRIGWTYPREYQELCLGSDRRSCLYWFAKVRWSVDIKDNGKGQNAEIVDVCIYGKTGGYLETCERNPSAKLMKSLNAKLKYHIKKSIFNVRRAVGRQEFEIVWEGNNAYGLQIAQTLNHYYVCEETAPTRLKIACTGKID